MGEGAVIFSYFTSRRTKVQKAGFAGELFMILALAAMAVFAGTEDPWFALLFAGGSLTYLLDAWRRVHSWKREPQE
jgi:hypothetical protein